MASQDSLALFIFHYFTRATFAKARAIELVHMTTASTNDWTVLQMLNSNTIHAGCFATAHFLQ